MYYANLRGNKEWLFRQSSFGGPEHIILDASEYLTMFFSNPQTFHKIKLDTYCGRSLTYNPDYSHMREHDGAIRSACEYCFTEYEPETWEKVKGDLDAKRRKNFDGFPF
jgi:hypothetical protein